MIIFQSDIFRFIGELLIIYYVVLNPSLVSNLAVTLLHDSNYMIKEVFECFLRKRRASDILSDKENINILFFVCL